MAAFKETFLSNNFEILRHLKNFLKTQLVCRTFARITWLLGHALSFFILTFYLFIYLFIFLLVIHFIHISVYMSIPISQFITPPPRPPLSPLGVHTCFLYFCVSISALETSSSVPFSRFHIYALIYDICFSLSDLLHSL